ncbi:hypothetical protein ACGF3C_27080 [Micromonospora sp. NPDC047762]|uniref:hypothetical protein n=1 Tax=unclassified Micromonospora TaxID=2617518 RepID=UPI0033C863E2
MAAEHRRGVDAGGEGSPLNDDGHGLAADAPIGRAAAVRGAAELAVLVDPDVRDTLKSVLRAYRGREARRLRERLQHSDPTASDADNC